MLTPTYDAVRAILTADPTVSGAMRSRLLDAVKTAGKNNDEKKCNPVIRRLDAAQRLSVSVKTLDLWRRQGRIRAVTVGAGTRAVAFRESDLEALLNGGVIQ